MLAIALGIAWLVLSPLCLWIIFRGRLGAKIGAVLTLAAMEAATVAVRPAQEVPQVVAYDVPAPPRPEAGECAERTPVPRAARLEKGHESLELFWSAEPDECRTAKVVLRQKGRQLRVWVHEGPMRGHREGMRTVPVRVVGDTASLHLALDVPKRAHYQPVDGRTGRHIAPLRKHH
ncbi:hypothetical protein ACFXJ8_30105 [Nonomuraea sp. NPDC059194]|uniref:hypothetical protein n=1 Tax=Nonomuraea sp. NPDC059194 TaxID=3346764 RepID=UPI00368A6008